MCPRSIDSSLSFQIDLIDSESTAREKRGRKGPVTSLEPARQIRVINWHFENRVRRFVSQNEDSIRCLSKIECLRNIREEDQKLSRNLIRNWITLKSIAQVFNVQFVGILRDNREIVVHWLIMKFMVMRSDFLYHQNYDHQSWEFRLENFSKRSRRTWFCIFFRSVVFILQ